MPTRQFCEWPAALTEKMIALLDQGMSNGKIAKALGLTRSQVLGKIRRLGLKTKNPPPKEWPKNWLNSASIEKMTKLASQGLSARQIAKTLGLTRGRAKYRIGRLGLKTNPTPPWPAELVEKVMGLIDQGLPHRKIAETLGLTHGQVMGKLRRLGLETKNAGPQGKPRKVALSEKAA